MGYSVAVHTIVLCSNSCCNLRFTIEMHTDRSVPWLIPIESSPCNLTVVQNKFRVNIYGIYSMHSHFNFQIMCEWSCGGFCTQPELCAQPGFEKLTLVTSFIMLRVGGRATIVDTKRTPAVDAKCKPFPRQNHTGKPTNEAAVCGKVILRPSTTSEFDACQQQQFRVLFLQISDCGHISIFTHAHFFSKLKTGVSVCVEDYSHALQQWH